MNDGYNPVKELYKAETGNWPDGIDYEVYRSRRQWVIQASDEEILRRIGLESFIEIPDIEYVEWLENKITELLKLR